MTQDIEDDFHNFEALNFPPDHPAREMQDTFFLPGGMLLRTHTSNGQMRVMETPPAAARSGVPGQLLPARRAERARLADVHPNRRLHGRPRRAGHDGASEGRAERFPARFFGPDTGVRFRSSFFPFTEPSAEVDISCLLCHGAGCRVCKQSGWTEILGSGMIHPNVLRAVGYDPAEYQGFAFGMGVERHCAAEARSRRHAAVLRK